MLLSKIQRLGASGKMLNWFSSYLDHTKRVPHNGGVSKEQIFKCGIQQGSCLWPTLFIFYINDVFLRINDNIKTMMFADDCVLYKGHISCENIIGCLQEGLNDYVDLGTNNNMYLNVNETKSMVICIMAERVLHGPIVTMG